MMCFFASIDYNTIFVAQNELKTSCGWCPHFNQKFSPKAQFLESGTKQTPPTASIVANDECSDVILDKIIPERRFQLFKRGATSPGGVF